MSATTSAATGRCFGIQRVCQVWERSRSALYARRARAHHRLGAGPARRGPPPRQSDAQLLAAIRTDLARSPFHGEGHRKVHARLRILDGIRVARTRVLRVMRPHGLLSSAITGVKTASPTHDVEGHHPGAQRDVGDWTPVQAYFSLDAGVVAGSSPQSNLLELRKAWRGTCAKSGPASRHSVRTSRRERRQASQVVRWTTDVAHGLALRMDHGSLYLSDQRPQAAPVLADPPQFRLCRGTGNERCRGAMRITRSRRFCDPRPHRLQNLEAVRETRWPRQTWLRGQLRPWRLDQSWRDQTPIQAARPVCAALRLA